MPRKRKKGRVQESEILDRLASNPNLTNKVFDDLLHHDARPDLYPRDEPDSRKGNSRSSKE